MQKFFSHLSVLIAILFVGVGTMMPYQVSAQIPSATAVKFKNPLAKNTVAEILGDVLLAVQAIVGVLAVLFIVVGAILYITSGGNSSRIELAKAAIWAAVIGLAIAIAAPSFLREIYDALGSTKNPAADALPLQQIVLNVLQTVLSLVGVLAITMLVVGGILYMTAAGDQTRIEIAKKTVVYAVIGLTVALVSLIVVNQIGGAITGTG